METIALVLFVLAALGGLILAVRHFKGLSLPVPLTVVHGLAAASGLVLVLLAYLGSAAGQRLGLALLILVVAALGGFFLVSFHIRGRRAPNAVVVIHALAAVAGVATLLVAVL